MHTVVPALPEVPGGGVSISRPSPCCLVKVTEVWPPASHPAPAAALVHADMGGSPSSAPWGPWSASNTAASLQNLHAPPHLHNARGRQVTEPTFPPRGRGSTFLCGQSWRREGVPDLGIPASLSLCGKPAPTPSASRCRGGGSTPTTEAQASPSCTAQSWRLPGCRSWGSSHRRPSPGPGGLHTPSSRACTGVPRRRAHRTAHTSHRRILASEWLSVWTQTGKDFLGKAGPHLPPASVGTGGHSGLEEQDPWLWTLLG